MPRKKIQDECDTPNCGDEVFSAGLCSACYSWHYKWSKRGVAAAQRYRKKVRRIKARIDSMLPDKPATSRSTSRRGENRAYLN